VYFGIKFFITSLLVAEWLDLQLNSQGCGDIMPY